MESGDVAAALSALALDIPQGADSAAEKLEHFLDLMLKWNRVYNLTAITGRAQMITHHLLDALSIVVPLDRVLDGRDNPRVLDAGTGPGLPGIPLAIARPHWRLTLVDSSSKKTAFVTQALAELGLSNATVVTGRVEDQRGAYDAIVSRAYSSLSDFTTQTRKLLASEGTWAAMKGTVPHGEIDALPADVECIGVVPLDVPGLDAERHLILMKVKR